MMQRIIGESIRGYTHIQRNLECQDRKLSRELEDGSLVLSVADGHGSRSCPYSGTGAELAVNTFCKLIDELHSDFQNAGDLVDFQNTEDRSGFQNTEDRSGFQNAEDLSGFQNAEDLSGFLNHQGGLKFAQTVERAWKEAVQTIHREKGLPMPMTQIGEEDLNALYRLYGTTLLGLLIAPTFVFAFQIGDGDITYVDDGGVQPVVVADKLLGVESHSLCSREAWKKAVSAVHFQPWEQHLPCAFLLSTDGLSNSYADDEAFGQTCAQYFEALKTYGPDAVEENLPEWLSETSRLGCGDDTTLLMAYLAPDGWEPQAQKEEKEEE